MKNDDRANSAVIVDRQLSILRLIETTLSGLIDVSSDRTVQVKIS